MSPAFAALVGVLDQVAEVVRNLSDSEYRAPGPFGASGSVGKHVRHCLDHVIALENGLRTRAIDYDRRERGGSIESDRRVAIRTLESLCARLHAVDERCLPGVVQVTSQLMPGGQPVTTASTLGRELAFVISHTVHHNATISVMLERRDAVPARFGFAASTPCALSA